MANSADPDQLASSAKAGYMANSADPDQLASSAKAGYIWVQQDKG